VGCCLLTLIDDDMLMLNALLTIVISLRPKLLFALWLALHHRIFVQTLVALFDYCNTIRVCLSLNRNRSVHWQNLS
jgi:hypothetical protein